MRILFIPVSAPRGTGEYARSLAIALEAQRRSPDAEIHFIVSREAPYAGHVPFPTTLLPSSPTFHVLEVVAVIAEQKPDVVVFDNAGRTSQLRAARAAGARVVFVSSRRRQRRRAFRPHWLRLIDEHWIAMPEIIAGGLTCFERLGLRFYKHHRVRFIDTLLPEADTQRAGELLRTQGLHDGQFVLVAPGGGVGHRRVAHAPEIIIAAAERLASRGHAVLLVGMESPVLPSVGLQPMPVLVALIRAARLVVTNGADTLLQVLACARPAVAVPTAPDQLLRLARLEQARLSVGVDLDVQKIEQRALELLTDERQRAAVVERAMTLRITNGMDTAQLALAALSQLKESAG